MGEELTCLICINCDFFFFKFICAIMWHLFLFGNWYLLLLPLAFWFSFDAFPWTLLMPWRWINIIPFALILFNLYQDCSYLERSRNMQAKALGIIWPTFCTSFELKHCFFSRRIHVPFQSPRVSRIFLRFWGFLFK